MSQQVVFEWPKASRTSDPPSSHAAERAVTQSGARGKQLIEVQRRLTAHPGWTAGELSVPWLSEQNGFPLDRVQVARRLHDLYLKRLARKGPMRKCSVSGRTQMTWWPLSADAGTMGAP